MHSKFNNLLNLLSFISKYILFIIIVISVNSNYSYAQNFESFYPESFIPDSRLQDPVYTDPYNTTNELDLIAPKIIEQNEVYIPLIEEQKLTEDPIAKSKLNYSNEEPVINSSINNNEEKEINIPAGLYISVKNSFNGIIGAEIGFDLFNNLRIRTAASYLFYTLNITSFQNPSETIKAALTIFWPELIIDIYPIASSSFRFSFGVAYAGYKFELGSNASPHITANSVDSMYISYVNPAAPIIGIGWDFGRNQSLSFVSSIDIGVSWVGTPKITRILKDPKYDIFSNYENDIRSVVDKYSKYATFLPWINFTYGIKF